MLGQPMSMLVPQVVGFRLEGELPEGATATDLVLTVTQMLREHGVVGKFVEFYGPGVPNLPLADRATIGNMSPEFGSTCAMFPIDAETLRYLEFSGRAAEQIEIVEAYAREQGLWHDADSQEPTYSETLELDLGQVVPSLAGPKRPQDRVALTESKASFRMALQELVGDDDGVRTAADERQRRVVPRLGPARLQRQRVPRTGARAGRRRRHGWPAGVRAGQLARRAAPRGRNGDRARPRARRDRGHHELYQHVEPVGDDRRRAARQGRRGAGPRGQAVGEDVLGAGLEGRHGVLRPGGPDRVPGAAWLPPRGLRLYDLHRQLGPALGRDLRGGQRRGPRGRLGAVGQPQLRGPHQPRRTDELPGLAAAVRCLRAGRDDGHRPARRATRPGRRGRGRLPEGHLADRRGRRPHGRGGRAQRHVHLVLRRGVRRRRALELARGAGGRPLRVGRGLHVRAPAAVLRGPLARARAGRRRRGRGACSPCSATR